MRGTQVFAAALALGVILGSSLPAETPISSKTDPPLLKVVAGLSYYTGETNGDVLVWTAGALKGDLTAELFNGEKKLASVDHLDAGRVTALPIALKDLPMGESALLCRLLVDGQDKATAPVKITRLPPKPNEVKIDYRSGGLIVDGLPMFPFGFYCYSPVAAHLPDSEIINGFRHMSPYQPNDTNTFEARQAYMDRCAAAGMKVNYHLLGVAGGGGVMSQDGSESEGKWLAFEAEVKAFRDHPALLTWYIADEPEGRNTDPAVLQRIYDRLKRLDPYHPITMCITAREPARQYAGSMDIPMVDQYPVPRGPVTWIAVKAEELSDEFRNEKPTWMIPQSFGGSEIWTREPTAQEIRLMAHLAVLNGSKGVQYFVRAGPNCCPKSPLTWAECSRAALETAELTPCLLSHEPRPVVSCNPRSVQAGAWQSRGLVAIIAANTENTPRSISIRIEKPVDGAADVLFEDRKVQVKAGLIEDLIPAFGVNIYQLRIADAPPDRAQLLPGNLMLDPSFEDLMSNLIPAHCWASIPTGGTCFLDPRDAVHGRHSIRFTCPAPDRPVNLSFYPIDVQGGAAYSVSVYGRSLKPGVKFVLSFGSAGQREFELTTEWNKYSFSGTNTESRVSVGLTVKSPGVAWFDLCQVVKQ